MKLRIDAPRPVLELVALFMELDALAVELLFNHLSGGRKGVRRSDVVGGKMRGGGTRERSAELFHRLGNATAEGRRGASVALSIGSLRKEEQRSHFPELRAAYIG